MSNTIEIAPTGTALETTRVIRFEQELTLRYEGRDYRARYIWDSYSGDDIVWLGIEEEDIPDELEELMQVADSPTLAAIGQACWCQDFGHAIEVAA
jgi:hypothetical protein